MKQSRVVVAECPSYSSADVANALAEIMAALGGMGAFVRAGQTVLVKPNLFSPHLPDDAVTTHPELVRQVVRLCFEAGAARVWVGDSPVGVHDEAELWTRTGMREAIAGTGAQLKSWRVKHVALPCGEDVLAAPEWFPQIDVIVSLPKLKTHILTALTCAMKNVYGIVSGQAKGQFHSKYRSPETMSEFLVRVFETFRPHLTIADAVVAMEGNGPAHGDPLPVGVLIGGADAVAIDSVACAPLGIAPERVHMIRIAADKGLGAMDSAHIDCAGTGIAKLRRARMKQSLLRKIIGAVPEWAYARRLRLYRIRPNIREAMCVKCGMCAEACPREAISTATSGYPLIDQALCIDCFCCLETCPQSAIATRHCLGGVLSFTNNKRAAVERK